MDNLFDVLDFGAVADGETDSTSAFQKALDKAGEVFGTVVVPPGTYMCNKLTMRPRTGLKGYSSWSFRGEASGSIIKLMSANNECLLDITDAFGATIQGMYLEGQHLGDNVHGVMVNRETQGAQEDTPVIEDCYIGSFSGNGIMFHRIWCFRIRHSMVARNLKNGLYIKGWDGFVLDCWFTGNKGYGIMADDDNASVTVTGNRIEWNGGGVRIKNGSNWNLTGNYIDRSSGAGIYVGGHKKRSHTITMIGNIIYRSGAFIEKWPAELSGHENSQVLLDGCDNIVCTSNIMLAGCDDGGTGVYSPNYGIVARNLAYSIIKDNVGQNGCLKEFFADLGGHGECVKIADNFGSKKVL
ncbi:MAG: right-handed parallel beta-helix repeat-containing protein [Oscillospiraceae bacterium]|nr:right-handed parallel beta-helix repeat-containing protein [Oscillospiraceae bacterium]